MAGFKKVRVLAATSIGAAALVAGTATSAMAWQNTKTISTPYGTLESDVWYDGGTTSGATRQWNYQVTAKVGGSQSVAQIKSTWTGGADMRNSGSFSVTAGTSGVGVSSSSSWQYVKQTKYWSNTNGSRLATYSSNMVVAPVQDYEFGTISLINTAFVKFNGDARNWQISASA